MNIDFTEFLKGDLKNQLIDRLVGYLTSVYQLLKGYLYIDARGGGANSWESCRPTHFLGV